MVSDGKWWLIIWLVVWAQPLWKMMELKSVGMIEIPNMMGKS